MSIKGSIVALAIGLAGPAAFAQGYPATQYDAGMNRLMQQDNALSQQMTGFQNQVTSNAMNDPQVRAAYGQYRMQGGTQDFATWAFNYRATGGYSRQGMQAYRQGEAQNANNERLAYERYRRAQDDRAQAMQNQQNSFYNNQYQSGMQMGGWSYTRPYNSGTTYWYRP